MNDAHFWRACLKMEFPVSLALLSNYAPLSFIAVITKTITVICVEKSSSGILKEIAAELGGCANLAVACLCGLEMVLD